MTARMVWPNNIILRGMIEQRRLAAHARCRVKEWLITEEQAFQLADETLWMQREPRSAADLVESMKCGRVSVMGAKVVVR